MTSRERAFHHAARIALAPLVAALAYVAFPGASANLPSALEIGSVAPTDVNAPFTFAVPKPEAERAREAEDLASTVKPIVTALPGASDSAARAAARFFAVLDSAVATGATIEEPARAAGLTLEPRDLAEISRSGVRNALRRGVVGALRLSRAGYLPPGVATSELGREVVLRRGAVEHVVPSESLASFSEFLERAAPFQPSPRSASAELLYMRLLGAFFRPTFVYERAETEARRDALRRSVDTVTAIVRSGERIIGAHDIVTRDAAQKLLALRAALHQRIAGRVRGIVAAAGAIGLNTAILLLFGVFCYFYRPQVYRFMRTLGLFAMGFAVIAVGAGLVARYAPGRPELIPVALAAMLFTVLVDGRVSLVAAMVLAVLVGVQPAFRGTPALLFTFLGGTAAALSVRMIRRRSQVYYSIAIVTAVYAVTALLEGASNGDLLKAIGVAALLGGGNAVFSAMLAMLVLPVAETFTRSTTDLTLLELSDPNRPLLRRLATEAPGTYAHSIAMANLCEAACNAIGANGLLARVGCYYHDIGKLRHPQYFVENQGHARNPHEQLKPSASAAVIRSHVEDGIALADEHRLPEILKRFIPEHHGTAPIAYFLERAREEEPPAVLREEQFHYPGPLPQSAETAVALLADSVEAALRVLDDPTPEKIADAIEHLVQGRIEAGQLREAPLTLRQIDTVQREFVRVLTGMYHARLDYPEETGGITADWEGDRDA